jgi:hypothetical protein
LLCWWFTLASTAMLSIEWLRYFLSWFSLPVLGMLVVVFLWRRLYKEFPLFFSYIVVTGLITIIRLVAYARIPAKTYSDVYWISNLVGTLFGILAVYEVFVRRLFTGFYRVRFYRYLFPASALAITSLAVSLGFLSPNKWAFFTMADHILTFVRVALLGLFVALMLVMGRQWTRYEFGIAFGFGLLTAVSFFTFALQSRFLHRGTELPRVAWDITCAVWLICFSKPVSEVESSSSEPLHPAILGEAKKWEGSLKGWLAPPPKKKR